MGEEIRDRVVVETDEAVTNILVLSDVTDQQLGKVAAAAVEKLRREVQRLDADTEFKKAKAGSKAYQEALKKNAKATDKLNEAAKKAKDGTDGLLGNLSDMATAAQGAVAGLASIIGELRGVTAAALDAARAGADANNIAAAYERLGRTSEDLDRLQRATRKTVDGTTLQGFSLLAARINGTEEELRNVAQAAVVLSRDFPDVANSAELMQAALDGNTETLRRVGIVINEADKQFQGLSESEKKLAIFQEVAARGARVNIDAISDQALAFDQADTALADFRGGLETWFSEVFINSGLLDTFKDALDDLKKIFDKNRDTIRKFVDIGLKTLIKALELAVGVIDDLTSALRRMEDTFARVGIGAPRDLKKGVDKATEAARSGEAGARTQQDRLTLDVLEAFGPIVADTTRQASNIAADAKRKGDRKPPRRGGRSRTPEELVFSDEEARADEAASFVEDRGNVLVGAFGAGATGGAGGGQDETLLEALGLGASERNKGFGGTERKTPFDDLRESVLQLRDEGIAALDEFTDSAQKQLEANRQFAEDAADGITGAFVGAFDNIISGGQSFRDSMAGLMGELFASLSAAFLAWATAEGNLLAGNPFAAAAAAIALGVVASTISAFASRSSGGKRGGGTAVQRNLERERESRDDERRRLQVDVNFQGLATPDATAKSILAAAEQAARLSGDVIREAA